MKITLTKAEVMWYAGCYKELPPTRRQRFASALEADEHLAGRLQAAADCRGYLTCRDLFKVARWKYPGRRLLQLVAKNSEDKVRANTKASCAPDTDERSRIEKLRELDGVDWPMASTILHFVFPDCYPILDVRAMRIVGCKPNYNFKMWEKYIKLCRCAADKYRVTLRDLDRSLWTYDYLKPRAVLDRLGPILIRRATEDDGARRLLHEICREHDFKLPDGWDLQ